MATRPAALELQQVTAGYGDNIVLKNLDLVIPESSVVALLGRNGAGKSTALRVVSGFLRPQTGHVLFGGDDITSLSAHQRAGLGICCIAEGRSIFPSLSVKENLRMWALHVSEQEAIGRACDAFPILGNRLKQRAGSLSGGEQQMLAVARAYVQKAHLVFIDEVSLGLAPLVIDQLSAFLAELAKAGTTLVIIEQFVKRALDLADQVYVISRGEVAFHGSSRSLTEEALATIYVEK
jgi:branched-chain amino acid transport system ATP-binding protein